jgi:hypothetical protein
MKKIIVIFLSSYSAAAASTNIAFTVTVGDIKYPLWKSTNCLSVSLHTNNCYLIKYVENGKTNEFHAWMVPVKIEKN